MSTWRSTAQVGPNVFVSRRNYRHILRHAHNLRDEDRDIMTTPRLGIGPAGLLQGCSFGVTARSRHIAQHCAEHLAPATAVYIAASASDDPQSCVQVARQLRRAGLVPVPHIVARDIQSIPALDAYLGDLAQAGVTRALIVGGDEPQPRGPFDNGLDLLWTGLFQKHGIADLGLPWHLEGHPILSETDLKSALTAKIRYIQDNGLRVWLVSQFSLAAAPYIAQARQQRAMGLELPLIAGIAGPCDRDTLIGLARRCHVGNSVRLLSQHCHPTDRLANPGAPEHLLADIAEMAQDDTALFAGAHVYAFGGVAVTAAWVSRITSLPSS
jgi:methylenetetrahydrofolate reductase (NADPH)